MKKNMVGDKKSITLDNGEKVKGIIIDYYNYPGGRVFLVQCLDGKEREIREEKKK